MKLWSKQFFFRMLAKLDAESPLYLFKFLLRTSVCLVRSVSKNKGHIVCTHLCLNFSLLLFRNMLLHCLVLSTHVNLSDLQLLPGLPSDSVIGDSPPPANFQKSTPWDLTPWKKNWFPEAWEALESEESLLYGFVGSRLASRKVSVLNWAIRCTKTQAPRSHVENTLPMAALIQPVSDMFHMISEGVKSSQYLHTEKQQTRAKPNKQMLY